MSDISISDIKYLAFLKKTNPEKYEQELKDIVGVMEDMARIVMPMSQRLAKELYEK